MSRAVCGVCFCPYGDEGDCACQPSPVAPPHEQQEPLLQEIARLHDRIKDLEMDVEFLLSPANTSAGQRSVKQLTSEEILEIGVKLFGDVKNGPTIRHSMKFVRAIEAKLREKNT